MNLHFTRTDTILDKILATKVEEVATNRELRPGTELLATLRMASPVRDFAAALRRKTVALIAEVKKASPSKGVLTSDFDPLQLGKLYAENGAAAISVLTDERYFHGHLDYLAMISNAVSIPTLRKDFVIDPYQILEARAAGASAVLLIVAALEDSQLVDLHQQIEELGMTALVEVHHEGELARALKAGATVIGVNNRDLKTFHVDIDTTARIARLIPPGITLVAESGLKTAEDIVTMGRFGAHAVLIGEGIVTHPDRKAAVQMFSSQVRGANES
jgi:indole-3-glycerol phosphate synthase